ncbi:hypothetical protein Taro_012647 [Colocasia esculenta]|uniref:Uncharacterized protein n=1 Tax=Colocasia esculenta TaxID=4460 RepID=A0A843U4I0_COLES|nr:hypothetical protein [Colocasia esculenta]
MSSRGQKTFIPHSKIVFPVDDHPISKRLPRLRELMAGQPYGFGLSRRSEVVFNSARELVPRT